MQQTQTATPPLHLPENRCPDCLYLKLEGKTVGKQGLFAPIQNRIDFDLDINFNEQWEQMPGGRIKFGLTGGELRLKLENGSIPYELRELKSKFELAIPKERQQQASQDSKEAAEASLEANPLKIAKTAIKGLLERKFTAGTTDKFQFISAQVTTKGEPENPAWVFQNQTGESVLKGSLTAAKLGTMEVGGKPCRVEATFEVSLREVKLTDAEGLWSPDISDERKAAIERGLAKLLLKHKFKPYLSRQVLQYD
jgi:hypothetical protein